MVPSLTKFTLPIPMSLSSLLNSASCHVLTATEKEKYLMIWIQKRKEERVQRLKLRSDSRKAQFELYLEQTVKFSALSVNMHPFLQHGNKWMFVFTLHNN